MDILNLLLQIIILAFGFILLVKGADWFVDGSSSVAVKLKIPQIVIGLTIVAMGTSAPEAAVSITAALSGNAAITVGNIVGSNILNILIILGLSSVIVPLAVANSTIKFDIPVMIAITVLLMIFGADGVISLFEGIIFLVIFLSYLAYLFIMTKKDNEPAKIREMSFLKAIIFTVIGLLLIILGSKLTVDSATKIAQFFGISERFIGLTVVALGTSLPELFTSVNAARKGNADIAIGNIVGSNIFNILFVIGISAVIIPVPFETAFMADTVAAIGSAVLLLLCSLDYKKITRFGGVIMLLCYAAYFVFLLYK